MGRFWARPGRMKNGRTKFSGDNEVSRTRRRRPGLCRKRRGRSVGNAIGFSQIRGGGLYPEFCLAPPLARTRSEGIISLMRPPDGRLVYHPRLRGPREPPYCLAPGGVCLDPPPRGGGGELLPRLFTLARPGEAGTGGLFLWHFPSPGPFAPGVPPFGGRRALWSSEVPLRRQERRRSDSPAASQIHDFAPARPRLMRFEPSKIPDGKEFAGSSRRPPLGLPGSN